MTVFPTASKTPRPIRLPEEVREWAWESLHGKYGDKAMVHPSVLLDDGEELEGLSLLKRYGLVVRRIAELAPLRLCEHEKICGSATLGDAIYAAVPARYKGEPTFTAVNHLTLRYDKVLRKGLSSYEEDIHARLQGEDDPKKVEFLESLQNVIESIRILHGRYLDATRDVRPDMHEVLLQVPFSPSRNFREGLQSLWFIFAFTRLMGNWPGIGRLDVLLGELLENDLESGALTLDGARELLASFFIKGCEWIRSDTPAGSGDAQHYQNIVLGGIDEEGREVTNTLTYLTLQVVEELGISDYPITVRLNKNSPLKLKEKMAEVMRHGGGIVALYNEDLILESLEGLGYPARVARTFANDGCWEVQIPGATDFSYMPFDALQILNEVLGLKGEAVHEYNCIEEIYSAFLSKLDETVAALYKNRVGDVFVKKEDGWQALGEPYPSSVVSLFEEGCIESGRSYFDHGPRYIIRSPHIGGAPDVANSLYAIKQLVFTEKKVTLPELISALKDNWEGEEALRLYVKNKYIYYGNDSDEADAWHSRLLNDFADIVYAYNGKDGSLVKFIPGVSTFGRQVDWLPNRCATAFGYKKGDILSGNDSPVPGTDTCGATAIIKSYCKSDLKKQACGAALDVKLFPDSLEGDNGITALCSLMDGFLALGGFFMQLDTVDTETLLAAQRDPQKYKTLSVRVSGWNARFVTLNREWQNMIIERSGRRVAQ